MSNYTIHSIMYYVNRNSWPPKYRSGHPAGHPKLLPLQTPLRTAGKPNWERLLFCATKTTPLNPTTAKSGSQTRDKFVALHERNPLGKDLGSSVKLRPYSTINKKPAVAIGQPTVLNHSTFGADVTSSVTWPFDTPWLTWPWYDL